MQSILNDLSSQFQKKGFLPIEIPGLIKDVLALFDKGECCSVAEANRELEDLGWGLEIIDPVIYEIIVPGAQVH